MCDYTTATTDNSSAKQYQRHAKPVMQAPDIGHYYCVIPNRGYPVEQGTGNNRILEATIPTLLSTLIIGFVFLSTAKPVLASEVNADIFIANNYIFRGLTRTEDQVTVQGGVYYYHDIGFDLGLRISNVDFRPGAGPKGAPLYTDNENIYTIGYTVKAKELSFRLGFTNYEYPSGGGPRFHEFNGDIGYKAIGLSLNYDAEHENLYSRLSYQGDINERIQWLAHIGYYKLDDPGAVSFRKSPLFNDDYADILLGIYYQMENAFTWGIEYSRTDLKTNDTDEYGRFVISLRKSFELWSSGE